ncbi:MAG: F0F1 ATP synthase subunit delta [Candidatus Omnitrophica bacterium]|nr:F0F1 ATP synthase subunit delta [Candidatus Omnitrophota bacterium]
MIIFVVIFFVIMFIVFILVFRRIMNQNITSAVAHLDEINQDYMKRQEQANRKLEDAERVYQETLNKAKEEALSMRQDILKKAEEEKERIMQNAKNQADELIQQGEKTRHLLISELEKRIDIESIKKSSLLISRALPDDVRSQIHSNLVKEFIDVGLSQLKSLEASKDLKEAKVITALALNKDQKDSVLEKIKEKFPKGLVFSEEVDQNLVAGCMVLLGSLVLDGSLRLKISEKVKEFIDKENEQ